MARSSLVCSIWQRYDFIPNIRCYQPEKSADPLFGRDRTVIMRHIRNIFKEGELDENITCAKFAHMGADQDQTYETKIYNLDVIISVGYRVKSINGTKFRIWANSILKQYLIRGYAIDQRRIDHYDELMDVVRLMSRALTLQDKVSEGEYSGLFSVITDYVYALDTLDRYDYQALGIEKTTKEEFFHATYENAMDAINALKVKFGESRWFANEKDDSFKSSIGQIYQTFCGEDLYPSVEEKAAMLLYLVVKNYSFSYGNKRILTFWLKYTGIFAFYCKYTTLMVFMKILTFGAVKLFIGLIYFLFQYFLAS